MPEDPKQTNKQTNKLPYHPPTVTRIILRQEQAILSVCSSLQHFADESTGTNCQVAACAKSPSASGKDDQVTS